MPTIAAFESTYQKSQEWLRDLTDIGDFADEAQAYSALRCVLQALRDRLGVDEAAHLAAQLPLLIRGIFFEGWKPSKTPATDIKTEDDFLQAVQAHNAGGAGNFNVPMAVRAVFELLDRKITNGEIEDVKGVLPEKLRRLWP
jgi:uncharacterized protein (DUF2267 family)